MATKIERWRLWHRFMTEVWKDNKPTGHGTKITQSGRRWRNLAPEAELDEARIAVAAVLEPVMTALERWEEEETEYNILDRRAERTTRYINFLNGAVTATETLCTCTWRYDFPDESMNYAEGKRNAFLDELAQVESDGPGGDGDVRFQDFGGNRGALDAERKSLAASTRPQQMNGAGWEAQGWPLGAGSQGSATLWIRLDGNENIVERRVVKETWLSALQWLLASEWYGDVRDIEGRIHVEVKALDVLKDCPNVTRMTEWVMHADQRMYRVFMEFCPYGDLSDILSHHARNAPNKAAARFELVPEAFVWSMFESLARMAVSMQNAVPDVLKQGLLHDIIHLDIKPINVMFGERPSLSFRAYPSVKLGDFGVCIFTRDDDPFNPKGYRTVGTDCFMAPEQFDWTTEASATVIDKFLLSPKTNVWGIGKTVMQLMAGADAIPIQPNYTFGNRVPRLQEGALAYSPELRQLVLSCVAFDPAERPSPLELLRNIQRLTGGIGANGEDLAGGMRDLEAAEDGHPRHTLRTWAEKWAMNGKLPPR